MEYNINERINHMTMTTTNETITIEDTEGLLALPVGARLTDDDGDPWSVEEDGFRLMVGTHPLNTRADVEGGSIDYFPFTLDNPEVLDTFKDVDRDVEEEWAEFFAILREGVETLLEKLRPESATIDDESDIDLERLRDALMGTSTGAEVIGSRVVEAGTRVQLASGAAYLAASVGAKGTLRKTFAPGDPYVYVGWDMHDELVATQMDGGYTPGSFVVLQQSDDLAEWERELLFGDVVEQRRTVDQFAVKAGSVVELVEHPQPTNAPIGTLATVVSDFTPGEKYINVKWDEGLELFFQGDGGYYPKTFALVTPAPFEAGDTVKVTGPGDMREWLGLEFKVSSNSHGLLVTYDGTRPDGFDGREEFFWAESDLEFVSSAKPEPEPEPDSEFAFRKGDRVRITESFIHNFAEGTLGTVFEDVLVDSYSVRVDGDAPARNGMTYQLVPLANLTKCVTPLAVGDRVKRALGVPHYIADGLHDRTYDHESDGKVGTIEAFNSVYGEGRAFHVSWDNDNTSVIAGESLMLAEVRADFQPGDEVEVFVDGDPDVRWNEERDGLAPIQQFTETPYRGIVVSTTSQANNAFNVKHEGLGYSLIARDVQMRKV